MADFNFIKFLFLTVWFSEECHMGKMAYKSIVHLFCIWILKKNVISEIICGLMFDLILVFTMFCKSYWSWLRVCNWIKHLSHFQANFINRPTFLNLSFVWRCVDPHPIFLTNIPTSD